MEIQRVLSIKKDALDQCDNVPRSIVSSTYNGHMDYLKQFKYN